MNKPKCVMFFDDVIREYQNYYNDEWERKLVDDLEKYLPEFSKTSKISILTSQSVFELSNWFLKNDLYRFIDNISNPALH